MGVVAKTERLDVEEYMTQDEDEVIMFDRPPGFIKALKTAKLKKGSKLVLEVEVDAIPEGASFFSYT